MSNLKFPRKKRHEDVRFNVISITRRWVSLKFSGKKAFNITVEWHYD